MPPTGHYTSLSSYTFVLPTCCLSYLSFSAEGLHRLYYLSSSASFSPDGLHRPLPGCPFRRMVCKAPLRVLFGEWSPIHISYLFQALTRLSYLSVRLGGRSTQA